MVVSYIRYVHSETYGRHILTKIYFLFPQAALGPIALDMARQLDSEKHIAYANIILVISVLAIIFTAPLGAVLMTKLAPSWLQKSPPPITIVADCDAV